MIAALALSSTAQIHRVALEHRPITIESRLKLQRSLKVGYIGGTPASIVINDCAELSLDLTTSGSTRCHALPVLPLT